MQHRVQKQLLLSILVLPWCDEAIYLRCMSKKQTYAKKYRAAYLIAIMFILRVTLR